MKTKSKINLILVLMLTISISAFGLLKNNIYYQDKASLKMGLIPESLSELKQQSDCIILGSVEDEVQKIEYEDVTFYLTSISVKENYYGEAGKSIWLLQTYSYEDPIVTNGEQVLLFLSRYSGPVTNKHNVYVCSGLGYGQYAVKGNKIVPVLEDYTSKNIVNEIGEINLLIEKVNTH